MSPVCQRGPLVSVIVPSYNHQRFVSERLSSITAQDYRDIELIVLDDSSSDDSVGVIRQALKGVEYRFFINTTNSGSPFHQWDKGIRHANGKYIWIAESDDAAEPSFLSTLVPLLEKSSAALGYCQSTYIDEQSQPHGSALKWTDDLDSELWKRDFTFDGHAFLEKFLSIRNVIPNASAVVFRRDAYLSINSDVSHYKLCGDWVIWARMVRHVRICYSSKHLNLFRCHLSSVRRIAECQRFPEYVLALEEIRKLTQGFSDAGNLYRRRQHLEFLTNRGLYRMSMRFWIANPNQVFILAKLLGARWLLVFFRTTLLSAFGRFSARTRA